MVSAKDIKVGHLLISTDLKLYCVTKIEIDFDCPDRSIITGINKKREQRSATPDLWLSLLNPSIDISKID